MIEMKGASKLDKFGNEMKTYVQALGANQNVHDNTKEKK